MIEGDNWRNDSGLESTVFYKRKFALTHTMCADGSSVWLTHYYKKYQVWSYKGDVDIDGLSLHTDFVENISEEEYIVRKLSGVL